MNSSRSEYPAKLETEMKVAWERPVTVRKINTCGLVRGAQSNSPKLDRQVGPGMTCQCLVRVCQSIVTKSMVVGLGPRKYLISDVARRGVVRLSFWRTLDDALDEPARKLEKRVEKKGPGGCKQGSPIQVEGRREGGRKKAKRRRRHGILNLSQPARRGHRVCRGVGVRAGCLACLWAAVCV